MKINTLTILLLFLLSNYSFAQQISVNNSFTANHLIENIFLNGTCTEVTNVQVNGHTFYDGINSWGYFNANNSAFPLTDGIILTTGKLNSAPGPNANILSEGPQGWLGDQDLEFHTNVNNTHNATFIEFDFVPTANTISFEYVFASEQYLLTGTPSQCNYTDAFAFLLQDVTDFTPVQNLAKIPNTNIPVTSSTIRGAGGLCAASYPQYFGSFNNTSAPIAYNGNTIPLQAQATVIPGHTYHIKIVIADQGNHLYDSAVFLKSNSFNASINLGPNRLVASGNPLCANETLTLNATLGSNSNYVWTRNGVTLQNATQPQIEVSDSGTYQVTITQQNGCISSGEIIIEKDVFEYNASLNVSSCSVSGEIEMTFNLNDQIPLLTQEVYESVAFYTTFSNGNLTGPINNPNAYVITQNETVYVAFTSAGGCTYISTLSLALSSSDIDPFQSFYCDADGTNDGKVSINTNTLSQDLLAFYQWNDTYSFTFHYTAQEAVTFSNPINGNFTNTVPNQQTIYSQVLVNGVCFTILPIQITIQNSQFLPQETLYLCKGDILTLAAAATNDDYLWNTGDTSSSIEIQQAGTYTVSYSSADGCEIIETFVVLNSDVPSSVSVTSTDFAGTNNSFTIHAIGIGNYEYSLDGEIYQDSPYFTGLEEGSYLVYIRDKNGCGFITTEAAILDYPKFFTPNGDGINDVWRIKNLAKMDPKAKIHVFDRFNRLIVSFPANYGWDGTRNGTLMYPTDYWFTVTFSTGKILRGHFHLKK